MLKAQYFLQVVKTGDEPKWPHGEEDMVVGSKDIGSGFTQYWAYLKDSGKEALDLPPAEVIASENATDKPAILIDQAGDDLEIVLVKDGHAWAKTDSSLDNLEDNITSILDFANLTFNMKVEHFMTTDRVTTEVEKKLDDLEEADENKEAVVEDKPSEESPSIKPLSQNPFGDYPPTGIYGSSTKNDGNGKSAGKKPSPLAIIIPVLLIGAAFVGVILFGNKAFSKVSNIINPPPSPAPTATPTPTPTPTPAPTVERSEFKVRVLNGTLTSGAAGALAKELEAKGWKILTTGNASNNATLQTLIRVKKDSDENLSKVMIMDLSGKYEASVSADLKPADKADVEVVIGKK